MNAHECTTDLAERQRRARVSSTEQRALEAHLSVCASCRTARQILADFHGLDTVDPQDGARIERFAALARSRVARAPVALPASFRRAKLARTLGVAAALALLVGSAFAAVHRRAKVEPKVALASDGKRTPSTLGALNATTAPLRSSAAGAVSAPNPSDCANAPPSAQPTKSAPVDSILARAPDLVSAASLLRQAGDALRHGEGEQAGLLYQKLQAQYPNSAEATVSHVSLGRLLAERGQPRAALREFDRYLSTARGGVLVPEALYGRARALTGVGERAEEQSTWQRLLRDFPDSAYADPARRRLAELE